MDKQIEKSTNTLSDLKTSSDFKGYTIEDLRYQRALVALQKDFAKSKLIHNVSKLKSKKLIGGDSKKFQISKASGVASKLLTGLSYLDYAMLGMSAFSAGKKFLSFFRRKK